MAGQVSNFAPFQLERMNAYMTIHGLKRKKVLREYQSHHSTLNRKQVKALYSAALKQLIKERGIIGITSGGKTEWLILDSFSDKKLDQARTVLNPTRIRSEKLTHCFSAALTETAISEATCQAKPARAKVIAGGTMTVNGHHQVIKRTPAPITGRTK